MEEADIEVMNFASSNAVKLGQKQYCLMSLCFGINREIL